MTIKKLFNKKFSLFPFPVASFIASSASLNVEAELFFLFFISLPQLMIMMIIMLTKTMTMTMAMTTKVTMRITIMMMSHVSILLVSLNSTWALLNFFVLATMSVKHWSDDPDDVFL